MATNLRLRPDAEAALRAEAERSGRSQQEILRDALDRYLDLIGGSPSRGDALLRSGTLLPPRTRYRRVMPTKTLPAGVTSLDLLDRDERLQVRVYLDSSAVLKRVIVEAESAHLVTALDKYHAEGDVLVSSSLSWIEVARALRSLNHATLAEVANEVDAALSGVAEHPLVAEVVALARRVNPAVLRSLDAIHLASALLLDADIVLTYDQRLAAACTEGGLAVAAPGQ